MSGWIYKMRRDSKSLIIDRAKCTSCGLCVKACVKKIINLEDFTINNDKCFRCFHCYSVCPADAIIFPDAKFERTDKIGIKPESFENLIYHRKSHRNFLDKEIPSEVFKKAAGIAGYSPTATNSQSVHLTVINGREKVKKFSDRVMNYFKMMSQFYNGFTALIFSLFIGRTKAKKALNSKKFVERYFSGYNILTFDAPSLILFHAPRHGSSMAEADCNIAATTVMLYLETAGLSSCFMGFITLAMRFNKNLKKSLNIPNNHIIHAALAAGYPELKYLKKTIRKVTKIEIL